MGYIPKRPLQCRKMLIILSSACQGVCREKFWVKSVFLYKLLCPKVALCQRLCVQNLVCVPASKSWMYKDDCGCKSFCMQTSRLCAHQKSNCVPCFPPGADFGSQLPVTRDCGMPTSMANILCLIINDGYIIMVYSGD